MNPPNEMELAGLRIIVAAGRGGFTRPHRRKIERAWAAVWEALKWLEREAL